MKAIAFNMLAKRDIAAECAADIRDSLEHQLVPEVIENPENNFEWCDCKPEP